MGIVEKLNGQSATAFSNIFVIQKEGKEPRLIFDGKNLNAHFETKTFSLPTPFAPVQHDHDYRMKVDLRKAFY
jgi:hypothetical protein